jgi:putative tryptophan/tyrosine transport system substrate-binding protein
MQFDQVKRREFILVLGTAATWPLGARAQQASPVPHVGLVSIGADPGDPVVFRPFLEQLRTLGYIEGHNVILERRFAAGRDELIGDFVTDLVRRKVDIIVVTGNRETITAKHATSTIPIVTIVSSDPIRTGLAASLARPGGNVTGLTTMDWGIYGKRIEILKQAVPKLSKAALLLSRGNGTYARGSQWAHDVETDARSLGVELSIVETESTGVEATIASAAVDGAQALVGASDGVVVARRREIAESAITHRLPTMFAFRQNVEAGGLIMYAARVADLSRRAAFFVDRILKGARPSELPIEEPTTFELIINLKTAKILGLTLPPALLAQADEVIE